MLSPLFTGAIMSKTEIRCALHLVSSSGSSAVPKIIQRNLTELRATPVPFLPS